MCITRPFFVVSMWSPSQDLDVQADATIRDDAGKE